MPAPLSREGPPPPPTVPAAAYSAGHDGSEAPRRPRRPPSKERMADEADLFACIVASDEIAGWVEELRTESFPLPR